MRDAATDRRAPGAVALVARTGWRDTERARRDMLVPYRDRPEDPRLFCEGALMTAWPERPGFSFHATGTTACLFVGSLYELMDDPTAADAAANPARTVAAAYERDGERILECLRGDFWILLWDLNSGSGLLAVDQIGGMCPYWSDDGSDLVIASDVPELLAMLPRRPEPDAVAVAHWLSATSPPGGATLYAGVRRLEAGHKLRLGSRVERPERYWSPVYRSPLHVGHEEAVELLRASLSRSVHRRVGTASDTGVRLSGGLDSSVVAAIAARQRPGLRAYSATFPGHPETDETHLIDQTVEHVGLRSTRIVVRGGSIVGGAAAYMQAWDLPPSSPNLFFWDPLLGRAGDDGVRVMLDGEGGDELFGLSPYLLADRLRGGRLLSAIKLASHWPPPWNENTPARVRLRLRRFGVKGALPASAHSLVRRLRPIGHYALPWLAPELRQPWLDTERSLTDWKRLRGPRWWASLVGSVIRGPGAALVYEQSRRIAAGAGIEARHPIVDVDVIELVLRFPPELAFDAHLNRPLLREAVTGLLPNAVRLRPHKSNFDAVFHDALAGRELALVRRVLTAPEAELRAYADLDIVRRVLLTDEPPRDRGWRLVWALRTWRLLTAECWLRSQADPLFLQGLIDENAPAADALEIVGGEDAT